MSEFGQWFSLRTQASSGRFKIWFDNEWRNVYSERGTQRELRILGEKFPEAGESILYFAPWHDAFISLLDKNNLVWVALGNFGSLSHPQLIKNSEQWEEFLRELSGSEKFSIVIHPLIDSDELQKQIAESFRHAASRLKAIRHFEKTWQYNFRRNRDSWLSAADISQLKLSPTQTLLLAGPSADDFLNATKINGNGLWSADTALLPLAGKEIVPDLVFSIDAGFGSREHFSGLSQDYLSRLNVVLDPLSFPELYQLPFRTIYTYASSHPLIQQTGNSHTNLVNATGDVRGIMQGLNSFLFPGNTPQVIGGEGKHRHYVSHLRGSAYHRRSLFRQTRTQSRENYFLSLSRRYS